MTKYKEYKMVIHVSYLGIWLVHRHHKLIALTANKKGQHNYVFNIHLKAYHRDENSCCKMFFNKSRCLQRKGNNCPWSCESQFYTA